MIVTKTTDVPFDLDVVGALEGTDKSSSVMHGWDYLRHYQGLFEYLRDEPINFIEIGVQRGLSVSVWRRFFNRARIIGIDINPECRRYEGDRVTVEIGSQDDPAFLHEVCAKYPPTIVIDDGSHLAHHMVFSFEQIFPALLPGGYYVVEDTETQFRTSGQNFRGDGSVSVSDYFGALARDRMANGSESRRVTGRKKYIADHVDSITFIGSAIILRKRKPRDIAPAIAFASQYLAQEPATSERLVRFAWFVLRHNGPLDLAEEAGYRAIRMGEPKPSAFITLMRVLDARRKFDAAVAVAMEGLELWPTDIALRQTLGLIQRHADRPADAVETFRGAAALRPDHYPLQVYLSDALEATGDLTGALAAATKAADMARPQDRPVRARRVDELRQRIGATRAAAKPPR